ncbi:MAG: hypothetical protein QE278_07015 [Limnobacter sp.]|nr:hypothetical protein [Limnobacter sp.]
MIQDNLFNYGNFKFLKWGLLLSVSSGFAYVLDEPRVVSNGGTPLGYTLGTIGALLILWLMWLGVRKRSYTGGSGNLRAWVSAHIYLGLSLILVGTLHAGFQLGWNVHSLAYVLMMLTIFSGIWGLGLYVKNPKDMSDVLNRLSPEDIVSRIDSLDKDAAKMNKDINTASLTGVVAASLAQGIYNKKSERRVGEVKNCKTEAAVNFLQKTSDVDPSSIYALYQNQAQRLLYLKQLRKYYRYKYWLELWLAIHVPVSFGLLASLTAHIVSVFFYW